MRLFGLEIGRAKPKQSGPPVVSVEDLPLASAITNFINTDFNGDKFFQGFGFTEIQAVDYWTLRARSSQLFNDNLYARGLIRRLVTNEINTGLTPDTSPEETVLKIPEDSLTEWSENIETLFSLWGNNPAICDYKGASTFGGLQATARREALIAGDVLVLLRQSQRTKLPMVQLVSGSSVQTPTLDYGEIKLRKGHEIKHGVEVDPAGRHVAYWVKQSDGTFKRVVAVGEKSGRRLAWLVYGTDKRLDDVRGQPILSLVLQSLKEVDRYRDSVQRKAVINSMLAMFIKKTEDKPGTLPVTGGAVRKDALDVTQPGGTAREFNLASNIPGMVFEELQTGEEPVGFHSQGIDLDFGKFEEAIIQAVAWANEVPPEIMRLAFSNNYSASQAAINEFKIYLNRVWGEFGSDFCSPVYTDWLVSLALIDKVQAVGFLKAWRTPAEWDTFGAWVAVEWYGSIKPSTDMLKQVKASAALIEHGLSTHAREARTTTGTKFTQNVKKLRRENALLVEARRPLAEFEQEFTESPGGPDLDTAEDAVVQLIEDHLQETA